MDCDKNFIILNKFSSFFNDALKVKDHNFILKNGKPFIGMNLFH